MSLFIVLLSAVAAVLATAALAVYRQHLLVMRWDHRGYFFMEARGGGRYAVISPARIPWSLLRFAVAGTISLLSGAAGWVHAHLPHRAHTAVQAKG